MNILVVGGAGYIGSHMLLRLRDEGCEATVLDNLSTGHRNAVLHGNLVQGDAGDAALVRQLLSQKRFDAVMHFASSIQVAESVAKPLHYYANNLGQSLTLLAEMQRAGVLRFVFSSTAAVFGEPIQEVIDESHPCAPINPYGHSKRMVEQVLADAARAHGLSSVSFRYFNAAGADPHGRLGERHDPETHLIPLALQAAAGLRPALQLYGDDYPTPDGTCIRDYVHVSDLAQAHWLGVRFLLNTPPGAYAFNLGSGAGYSVREVIRSVEKVTGRVVPVTVGPRRPGDPERLVAEPAKARQALGWKPSFDNLDTMVQHAWAFMQQQPGGTTTG